MTALPHEPTAYTPEQLARLADWIADGRDAFPSDLNDSDHALLTELVRKRLRVRLIRHIARAIASWLGRKRNDHDSASFQSVVGPRLRDVRPHEQQETE